MSLPSVSIAIRQFKVTELHLTIVTDSTGMRIEQAYMPKGWTQPGALAYLSHPLVVGRWVPVEELCRVLYGKVSRNGMKGVRKRISHLVKCAPDYEDGKYFLLRKWMRGTVIEVKLCDSQNDDDLRNLKEQLENQAENLEASDSRVRDIAKRFHVILDLDISEQEEP